LRSLTGCDETENFVPATVENTRNSEWYERNLRQLKQAHHSRCLFNRGCLVEDLVFKFTHDGQLTGTFSCDNRHEGYDGMVHGGIVAAVIDASMAQCLMGHGIAAYTADLNIRYRFPIVLDTVANIRTKITTVDRKKIYSLEAQVIQKNKACITAKAKFFKINQQHIF
jgi:uncharacterized protein (TIGR00369 family)